MLMHIMRAAAAVACSLEVTVYMKGLCFITFRCWASKNSVTLFTEFCSQE